MAHELHPVQLQVISRINVHSYEVEMGKKTDSTDKIIKTDFQTQRVLKHYEIDWIDVIEIGKIWPRLINK